MVQAEKAAWALAKELNFDLVTVLPSLVLGPVNILSCSFSLTKFAPELKRPRPPPSHPPPASYASHTRVFSHATHNVNTEEPLLLLIGSIVLEACLLAAPTLHVLPRLGATSEVKPLAVQVTSTRDGYSRSLVGQLLEGKRFEDVILFYQTIDVRDAALAHILAAETPGAKVCILLC